MLTPHRQWPHLGIFFCFLINIMTKQYSGTCYTLLTAGICSLPLLKVWKALVNLGSWLTEYQLGELLLYFQITKMLLSSMMATFHNCQ